MKKIIIVLAILSVCQITNAVDANNFDKNFYLQKIKQLEQTVISQQNKIDRLTATLIETKRKFEQLQAFLQKQIDTSTSSLPFTGEETPLTLIEASPQKYIGNTFIAIGGIRVKDYYNYGYRDAKRTHVSLDFMELRPDKSKTGNYMTLYVKREIAESLIEEIVKAVNAGYRRRIIRVNAAILENRYSSSGGIMAELISWQFLSSDKKSWQDQAAKSAQRPKSRRANK